FYGCDELCLWRRVACPGSAAAAGAGAINRSASALFAAGPWFLRSGGGELSQERALSLFVAGGASGGPFEEAAGAMEGNAAACGCCAGAARPVGVAAPHGVWDCAWGSDRTASGVAAFTHDAVDLAAFG